MPVHISPRGIIDLSPPLPPAPRVLSDRSYFYVNIYIGSPPTRFAVIVDTGSTMTYVPCSSCGGSCGSNHQDAAFNPSNSSTATVIACSSPQCQCGSPTCGCSAGQCTYQRTYAEQSSSSGLLVQDLLLMEDGGAGAPVIFGCETQETGEIYKQQADGLLGLGNSGGQCTGLQPEWAGLGEGGGAPDRGFHGPALFVGGPENALWVCACWDTGC